MPLFSSEKNYSCRTLVLTQKEIDEVSTPKSRVFACKSEGGPAPESVKKMIEDLLDNI